MELKPLGSQTGISSEAYAVEEKKLAEKKAAEEEEAKKSGQPHREEDAGQVSVIEMNSANYNTWELVLNDEPYSDGCAALLALADRHLSRKEIKSAEKVLHEALLMLSELEIDESDHVSPEDRWQVRPLLRRVQLRMAWLAQGRDAYGRFATQAPPRRLSALVAQFRRHMERYTLFLTQTRERLEAADRARRTVLVLDLQRNESRLSPSVAHNARSRNVGASSPIPRRAFPPTRCGSTSCAMRWIAASRSIATARRCSNMP